MKIQDWEDGKLFIQDPALLKILEDIERLKNSDLPLLFLGETGTGKDLLAKAVHFTSNRKDKKFIPITCAAIPETLLESELFGYKKGAFTGAVTDKEGLIEEAEGGTLYLDEIAEVPIGVQVKLLRALEEKEITRLGELKPRKVNFRLITATNGNLDELIKQGRFRPDLYYRLNNAIFRLPPLRERADIPELIKFFTQRFLAKYDFKAVMDEEIIVILNDCSWPGNIRELEDTIEKLVVFSKDTGQITIESLRKSSDIFKESFPAQGKFTLSQKLGNYEKFLILEALKNNDWVIIKAAEELGIPDRTLRNKIERFGIQKPQKDHL